MEESRPATAEPEQTALQEEKPRRERRRLRVPRTSERSLRIFDLSR